MGLFLCRFWDGMMWSADSCVWLSLWRTGRCTVNLCRGTQGTQRIPLVLTYNPLNPNLMKIIKRHWQVLRLSPECKKLFPETPILAYRRNRNLRDTLVRASLLKPIQTVKDRKLRRNKCPKPNCTWCSELKTTNQITCTVTGCTFCGPKNINSHVNNVVYILTCNQCKKQYIGETGRPFIERWKEHLYDIKVKRPYPVARHFNESDNHQEATFHAKILSLIKGPANRVTARRKYRESRWISIFQVLPTRRHKHTRIDQTGHTSLEIHLTENPSISQPEIFKPSVPLTRNPLSYQLFS